MGRGCMPSRLQSNGRRQLRPDCSHSKKKGDEPTHRRRARNHAARVFSSLPPVIEKNTSLLPWGKDHHHHRHHHRGIIIIVIIITASSSSSSSSSPSHHRRRPRERHSSSITTALSPSRCGPRTAASAAQRTNIGVPTSWQHRPEGFTTPVFP